MKKLNRAIYEAMKRGIYRSITVTPAGKLGGVNWDEMHAAARSLGKRTGRTRWALIADALEEMSARDEGTIWAGVLIRCAVLNRDSYPARLTA